jgi:hypothetical protein
MKTFQPTIGQDTNEDAVVDEYVASLEKKLGRLWKATITEEAAIHDCIRLAIRDAMRGDPKATYALQEGLKPPRHIGRVYFEAMKLCEGILKSVKREQLVHKAA